MHRPASPCKIQKAPEPEPLVIQILIGAKVKFQEGDEGHIKELKREQKHSNELESMKQDR
jgi:hypothetical protein